MGGTENGVRYRMRDGVHGVEVSSAGWGGGYRTGWLSKGASRM